jgi:hypothetical protein
MLISLAALLVALRSIFRSRLELQLENLALRQQIGVLQRSGRKRLKLRSGDRRFWVYLSRIWRDWRSTLVIVQPETVVAWHRKGFRLFWTWRVRHGQPGRPGQQLRNAFPYDESPRYLLRDRDPIFGQENVEDLESDGGHGEEIDRPRHDFQSDSRRPAIRNFR